MRTAPLVCSALLLLASLPIAAAVETRYATYVGDDGYDQVYDVAVDGNGNALVVGIESFPDWRGQNLFIRKYSPDGALQWRAIFGNTGAPVYPTAIAADGAGNAYVVGFSSAKVPFTDQAWQRDVRGDNDAFVIQVMANGGWGFASMLGGTNTDLATEVDVDANGNVYVAGETYSCDFPTTLGAYQTTGTGCATGSMNGEAFVTKFRPGFSSVAYSTLLGGSGLDGATGLAVSRSSGTALLAGSTNSPDFDVTSGGYQRTFGGLWDGYVVKLAADGRSLLFGTYLGKAGDDRVSDVARDASSNVYVTGWTTSRDFPATPGAHQTQHNGGSDGCSSGTCIDAFVTKLDGSGASLRYSTFVGGRGDDSGDAIAVDATGAAYVTGTSDSPDFPVVDGRAPQNQWNNAFAIAVTPKGNALAYATALGEAPAATISTGMAARSDGTSYHVGLTDAGGLNATANADRPQGTLSEGYLVSLAPPSARLVFAPRPAANNEWWVEMALGGREANDVTKVEVRDTDGAWATLTHRAWGAWAGTYHVEPGHAVTYRVTLANGVVRQSCAYAHPTANCTAAPAFDAAFTNVKGNEWWVEATVSANAPLAAVEASVNGGAWRALTLRSWGAWAASFNVPEGSIVQLRATATSGATDLSGCYRWTSAAPVECGGGGGGGGTGTFAATFKNVRGNEWWVETDVTVSGGTLAGVDARVDGGAWVALTKQSYGSWAKSIHAPAGSTVEFRARSTDGQSVVSSGYRWPPA